jgi:iron complex outermembrane receptor protein
VTTFLQIGEQRSKGMDLDINTDLGFRTHLILNYGFAQPRFEDAEELTGLMPRYVPKHNLNAWLRKDWQSGFNVSIGGRYLGSQFVNNTNTESLGGYMIASGAVGFRAERWDWSLNAENLFNRKRYFLPGHFSNQVFPGQPINVVSSIRLKFN